MKRIPFEKLSICPLIVDAVYEGGKRGNAADDPISKLLEGTGNQGGFRLAGKFGAWKWIVLYTSGEDSDWPDNLDNLTGQFTYYGDNKTAGHDLHETSKGGNKVLREIFGRVHYGHYPINVPPTFIFRKYPTDVSNRSVQFLGLAVPGASSKTETEDLIAVWKNNKGERFQNYRAIFTVLDISEIRREWIDSLRKGDFDMRLAPQAWIDWCTNGIYNPLIATPTKAIRTIEQQSPNSRNEELILHTIWKYFKDDPYKFENFAAWLYALSDERAVIDEVTQRSLDGGRDAIGHYKLGISSDPVIVDFALEAKCYRPGINGAVSNTVGVKEVARLISRLKHRQFGVLVTTSQVSKQAYEEVRDDRHPVIFISGGDISKILIAKGYKSVEEVSEMLIQHFPNN
jgi:hypothetical protein